MIYYLVIFNLLLIYIKADCIIPPLTNTTPGPPVKNKQEERIVGYIQAANKCPTTNQIKQYTHFVFGWLIPYGPGDARVCQQTDCSSLNYNYNKSNLCEDAPTTWGSTLKDQISYLKTINPKIKILVALGGAGMGKAGKDDSCWGNCFKDPERLGKLAVEFVNENGFDGLDINFELPFDKAYPDFKKTVHWIHNGLKNNQIFTWSPTMKDLYNTKTIAREALQVFVKNHIFDFIMPQFFNNDAYDFNTVDGAKFAYSNLTELVDCAFNKQWNKVNILICKTMANSACGASIDSTTALKVQQKINTLVGKGNVTGIGVFEVTGTDSSLDTNFTLPLAQLRRPAEWGGCPDGGWSC